MASEARSVVIDAGSNMCKAGFGGDDAPRVVLPTLVLRPRKGMMWGSQQAYVGDEYQGRRSKANLKRPIENGVITNWDDMETFWRHVFHNELRIAPEDHTILLADAPLSSQAQRQRTVQTMFETFCAPAVSLISQSILTLAASGLSTGLVLHSGHGFSHAVPVHNDTIDRTAIERTDISGEKLITYLVDLLAERGYALTSLAEREIVRDIKEKLAYVAVDFDQEMSLGEGSWQDKKYELPDGQELSIGKECFRCPEALFQPALAGVETASIQQIIFDSIMRCDENIRSSMFSNIVLEGGSTMFANMAERLTKEIKTLAAPNTQVKVSAPTPRKYSVWIGGSILASLSTFQQMQITRQEYDEFGPEVVHRK
eukprot:TRINITY_DN4405_c0_g4_i1.p1 TRINITY_DN4405_c0_g4~~TRINITY_DN4405_c0_g4_i1.p1  ORF type:complete len:403 (+),score=66.51 TRINITY_DN4405_c0_g4_i1:101-1210(+)